MKREDLADGEGGAPVAGRGDAERGLALDPDSIREGRQRRRQVDGRSVVDDDDLAIADGLGAYWA